MPRKIQGRVFFRCTHCGVIFDYGFDEQTCAGNLIKLFLRTPPDEVKMVCDTCFQALQGEAQIIEGD